MVMILCCFLSACGQEEKTIAGSSITTLTPGTPQTSTEEDFSQGYVPPEDETPSENENATEEDAPSADIAPTEEEGTVQENLGDNMEETPLPDDFSAHWLVFLGKIEEKNQEISQQKGKNSGEAAYLLLEMAEILESGKNLSPPSHLQGVYSEFIVACEEIARSYEKVAGYMGEEVSSAALSLLTDDSLEVTENFYKKALAVSEALGDL